MTQATGSSGRKKRVTDIHRVARFPHPRARVCTFAARRANSRNLWPARCLREIRGSPRVCVM